MVFLTKNRYSVEIPILDQEYRKLDQKMEALFLAKNTAPGALKSTTVETTQREPGPIRYMRHKVETAQRESGPE